MIGFYTRPVNCDDADALAQHYGHVQRPYDTCRRQRGMIRASRAYFIVSCINFCFVVVTTAIFIYIARNAPHNYYTPTSDQQRPGRQRMFRRWQRTSLQRRSVFGTTLGACGHLVFSTVAFLSQAFYGEASCEVYMWGVIIGFYTWIYALCWRAYRLYFLIRLNTLKTHYAARCGGDQPRPCNENDRDHKWLMRNTDCRAIRVTRPLAIYSLFLIVIVIVCVLFEAKHLTCEDRWSVWILFSFVAFFMFVVSPVLMWRLKGYKDAHGIRNEILIDLAAGAIFSIITLVWYLKLNKPRPRFGPHYLYIAPRTWLVFFTTIGHFTSVVWPIWKLLPEWRKFRHDSDIPPPSATATPEYTDLQQTPETLERLLHDPVAVGQLIHLAVQDFSSENVLAYREYLRLVDCLQTQKYGRVMVRFSRRFHSSATTLVDGDTANSEEEKKDDLMQIPIESPRLLDDFTNYYDTYIRQGAPLQVNISYKARCELDSFFKRRSSHNDGETVTDLITPWSHKPAPLLPVHISQATRLSWGSEAQFPPYASSISISEPQLTLSMFEPARNELFWNIFASVFAKYISSHQ